MWTLTYSVDGNRRVEHIPDDLATMLQPLAEQGRAYRNAVNELLALNAQLVTLWRKQQRAASSPRRPRKK